MKEGTSNNDLLVLSATLIQEFNALLARIDGADSLKVKMALLDIMSDKLRLATMAFEKYLDETE